MEQRRSIKDLTEEHQITIDLDRINGQNLIPVSSRAIYFVLSDGLKIQKCGTDNRVR